MSKVIQDRQKKERELLLEQFRKTPIIQFACEKAGVGRATYYRWRHEDGEFALQSDTALEESVGLMNDLAESQLLSAIKEKNITAIIFWLKNRHRAYTNRLEINAKVESKNAELTPEQEDLIKKALGLSSVSSLEEPKND
jgi:ABC-type Fe3+ transport system substrate-binding protein